MNSFIYRIIILGLLLNLTGCLDFDELPESEPVATSHPDYDVDYRHRPVEDDVFYMVMTDRFWNADPANDMGDPEGSLSHGGFDLTSKHMYHGGDLDGLVAKFDYLQQLGITAIWLTPVFKGLSVVLPGFANYHGYLSYDYLNVDPHLGGNAAFKRFTDAAHARGIKVYMDVVVNHTADFIGYEECSFDCPFRPLSEPAYTPKWWKQAFTNQKNPLWLNNLNNYNNRGTATFSADGEGSLYGDFFGFDDLNTQQPEVINGWIDVFKFWISEYQIDGFRVDTVPHVHMEFWQQFAPQLVEYAAEQGIPHFRMFGEIAEAPVERISQFVRRGRLNSALDFPIKNVIQRAVTIGAGTQNINDVVAVDDYYTDTHSSGQKLGTFVSNHDFGRIAWVIQNALPDASESEVLQRSQLAHAMLLFNRGAPIIYYGDEQGFTGDNNIDENSNRLDMFPSQTQEYIDYNLIGTDLSAAADNFDMTHPLFITISQLSALRKEHRVLRRGIQIGRFGTPDIEGQPSFGMLAYSRIDVNDALPTEYVAVFNTSNQTQSVDFSVATPDAVFTPLVLQENSTSAPASVASDDNALLSVTLPPLGYQLYQASRPVPMPDTAFSANFAASEQATVAGDVEVLVEVAGDALATVDFFVKTPTDTEFRPLGSDHTPPNRVYWPSQAVAQGGVEFRFVATNRLGEQVQAQKIFQVDNRRIDSVNVYYENGNQRQWLVAYNQIGFQYGPHLLQDSPVRLNLSSDNSYLHLVFQDRSDPQHFLFDDVVRLNTQAALLPTVHQNASGEWEVDLYINNRHEIATSNNFIGDVAAPKLVDDPEAPAPLPVDVYIRGSNNSWGTPEEDKMDYLGNHIYRTEITLNEVITNFKVADDAWLDVDIGGLITDSPEIYSRGGPNLTFEVSELGERYYFYYIQKPDEQGNIEKIHEVIRVEQ